MIDLFEYKNIPARLHFKHNIKKWYNLTLIEYNEMYLKQNGYCMICNIKFSKIMIPYVDHDHKTKKVRGLLCRDCNFGLGYFKDDIQIFVNAMKYLKKRNN